MESNKFNLQPLDEQLIQATLDEFKKRYISHKKGFFIMAPSGVGKTYFVNHQESPDWIDGDKIWEAAGAAPPRAWWLESGEVIAEIDSRSDTVTAKAKEQGLWIMGASNNWLVPDAIVIPEWEEHKRLIKLREETHYDGGATSDRLDQVLHHRKWIMQWTEKGVPVFQTVNEATVYLSSSNLI
jgi:hypothetical protein